MGKVKGKTIGVAVLAAMALGKWYTMPELRELTGAATTGLVSAIKGLRSDGKVFTQRQAGNGRLSYRRVAVEAAKKRSGGRRGRALYPVEELPLDKVPPHEAMVGWDEVWRGKTWRDMPGGMVFMQKCNFFLWRRGRLKYDAAFYGVKKEDRDQLRARGLC